jgi:hypothetical protein
MFNFIIERISGKIYKETKLLTQQVKATSCGSITKQQIQSIYKVVGVRTLLLK